MKFFLNNAASKNSRIEIPPSDFSLPSYHFGLKKVSHKHKNPVPQIQVKTESGLLPSNDTNFNDFLFNLNNENQESPKSFPLKRQELFFEPLKYNGLTLKNREKTVEKRPAYVKPQNQQFSSDEDAQYDPEDQLKFKHPKKKDESAEKEIRDPESESPEFFIKKNEKRAFNVDGFLGETQKGKDKQKASGTQGKKADYKMKFKKIKPV